MINTKLLKECFAAQGSYFNNMPNFAKEEISRGVEEYISLIFDNLKIIPDDLVVHVGRFELSLPSDKPGWDASIKIDGKPVDFVKTVELRVSVNKVDLTSALCRMLRKRKDKVLKKNGQ